MPTFVPSKTREMRLIEQTRGVQIQAEIIRLAGHTKFDYEIAEALGITPALLSAWIARLGIRAEVAETRNAMRRSGLDKNATG